MYSFSNPILRSFLPSQSSQETVGYLIMRSRAISRCELFCMRICSLAFIKHDPSSYPFRIIRQNERANTEMGLIRNGRWDHRWHITHQFSLLIVLSLLDSPLPCPFLWIPDSILFVLKHRSRTLAPYMSETIQQLLPPLPIPSSQSLNHLSLMLCR